MRGCSPYAPRASAARRTTRPPLRHLLLVSPRPDFLRLREAPLRNRLVHCTLAPTEGPCQQNRGAGSPPRIQALGDADEVLRSRTSGCVDSGLVWRSLRKSTLRGEINP